MTDIIRRRDASGAETAIWFEDEDAFAARFAAPSLGLDDAATLDLTASPATVRAFYMDNAFLPPFGDGADFGGGFFRAEFETDLVGDASARAIRDDDDPLTETVRIEVFVDDDISRNDDTHVTLGDGDVLTSRIDAWRDLDAFAIEAKAGITYGVTFTIGESAMVDGAGVVVRQNGSGSIRAREGETQTRGFRALEDGILLLGVEGRDADRAVRPDGLDYTVQINAADRVPFGMETDARIAQGGRVRSAIDAASDQDTWRFEAQANAFHTFRLRDDGTEDALRGYEITLVDAQGADIDGARNSEGDDAVIEFFSTEAQTLFLNLEQDFGSLNDPRSLIGGYELEVRSNAVSFAGTQGDDDMSANGLDNVMTGLGGRDRLDGLAGNDGLDGGAGNDSLLGGAGNDELNGGGGRDALSGGAGRDALIGAGGRDALAGGGGRDALSGGGGRDALSGGGGRDRLDGGGGNDRLDGGGGADRLEGGRGRDVFVQSGGRDRVLDWKNGQDVLEIANGAARFAQLKIKQRGDDVFIDTRAGDFRVEDARVRQFDAGDFDFV